MAELQDATEVTQPRSSWYDGFVGMSALLDKDSKDTTPKNWRVHCTLSGPDESSLLLVFTKKRGCISSTRRENFWLGCAYK